ncbi:MAG TPA: hypothetical protein VLY23_08135 [Candidatus Acidoferrum sp.]|nr:hypothetical protein [Candidatus Acidoferrum sp.]
MDGHEHVSLIILAVDPLTDGDELHAGEIHSLEDPERIFRAPGEARRVVKEDRVERSRGGNCGVHHAAEGAAIDTDSAHRFVHVDVVVADDEAVRGCVLTTLPDLICCGELALLVGRNAGVDRSAACWVVHRTTSTSEGIAPHNAMSGRVFAMHFSLSESARKSRTRIGTTTRSTKSFNFASIWALV